jgi:hypothetical protein
MWPWGHAAAGYLLLSLWWRRADQPPSGVGAIAAGLGTQLPDLVDKPLAWTVEVLPNGRSLGHSALTAALLCTLLWIGAEDDRQRRAVGAFAIGYWSHLATDAVGPLIYWDLGQLAYLAYPLVAAPPKGPNAGFLEQLRTLGSSPLLALELVLVALALVAWHRDGYPALRTLGAWAGLIDREPA